MVHKSCLPPSHVRRKPLALLLPLTSDSVVSVGFVPSVVASQSASV